MLLASTCKKKIKELDEAYTEENNTIPEVVDLLSKYCTDRGYIPKFSTIDEPIIDFLNSGGVNLDMLGRYEFPPVQGALFKAEMERHFKESVRWITEM